ncbi:response regulator transcription factor [Caulobacter endophyticus]|uniref:LuxR family transcriptional regulator n=1 Tax=Caulobacter endophyticus TaxID=2172652 RepID=A0A2T9KCJ9_9CAUL|nr:helix-turn-helix transcriptional regulator [Caulobacter endophyticus]PVM93619.1 LuxR family transcriptional regulator [Caulobacter endophyticus]
MPRRFLLTPRQREVLSEAKKGKNADQIAHKLGISVHTVNSYFIEAYRRLGARNRAHAVALAVSLGEI